MRRHLALLLAPLLLLALTVAPALAITLRSGKGLGTDATPEAPQQPQQGLPPQPGAAIIAGGNVLHDAAVFVGHHVFGLAGLGATAGSAYRFGPASVEWVRSQTCYRTGSDAYWTSSADAAVTTWERNVWAMVGGATGCLQAAWKGLRMPEALIPKPLNPYNKELRYMPQQERSLRGKLYLACGLALLRWLYLGLPRPANMATTGLAAFWSFVAAVGFWAAATLVQGHKRFEQLHDTVTAWYGQPTPNQWQLYRGLRYAIIALDLAGSVATVASLLLTAQALWEWASSAVGKEPQHEDWTEAEAHPAPTPTLPGSPKGHGPIPEDEEVKEEVKQSEPESTKAEAGGAMASVR